MVSFQQQKVKTTQLPSFPLHFPSYFLTIFPSSPFPIPHPTL